MKTLLYGGAFNPPTKAHIELADYARKYLNCDQVIFMPSKRNYILEEEGKEFAFADEERLAMLERIAENRPWMVVSDYELCLESQPRTYFTLKHLSEEGADPLLLIGSDWLRNLQTGWLYIPEICKEYGIAVMERNGDNVSAIIAHDSFLSSLQDWIQVVPTPSEWKEISGRQVRAKMARIQELFEEIHAMVPEELNDLREYFCEGNQ